MLLQAFPEKVIQVFQVENSRLGKKSTQNLRTHTHTHTHTHTDEEEKNYGEKTFHPQKSGMKTRYTHHSITPFLHQLVLKHKKACSPVTGCYEWAQRGQGCWPSAWGQRSPSCVHSASPHFHHGQCQGSHWRELALSFAFSTLAMWRKSWPAVWCQQPHLHRHCSAVQLTQTLVQSTTG